jgi:rod shape-determining protein MreD
VGCQVTETPAFRLHREATFCENLAVSRTGPSRGSPGREEADTQRATIRKGRLIVCALVLFLIQGAVAHRLSGAFLRFDLLYLLAAFLALEAGEKGALWSALGIGVLRDLGSTGHLGGSAVLLVVATAALLHFRNRIYREAFVTDALLVFTFVLFCGLGHAAGTALVGRYAQWGPLLTRALGQALLTGLLYPPFAYIFDALGLMERRETAMSYQ